MSEDVKYPYPLYDEETGYVICQICGKKYVRIVQSHLLPHEITLEEYKISFPDAPLVRREGKNTPEKYPYPLYDEETGDVICQLCGKPFAIISTAHLKKHETKIKEYKLRFPNAPMTLKIVEEVVPPLADVILPYPPYDEETGKVICQICGKSFITICQTHLLQHKTRVTEYKIRFPNAPLVKKEGYIFKKLPYPAYNESTGEAICQVCGKSLSIISTSHLKMHKITLEKYKEEYPQGPLTKKVMNIEKKLPYPPFEEETEKVICQICGESFLTISPRHLGRHHITYSEYRMRFPNAPLTTRAFGAITKYGKMKIFQPTEVKEDELEEIIVEEDPVIEEEINIEKLLKQTIQKDPVQQSKDQVFDTLRTYFTNIRPNYFIEEYGPMSKRLKYQFITDFADPVLKIVVQFPRTFWHNNDTHIDLLKHDKLRADGWKVIIIKGKSPTQKDIHTAIHKV